MQQIFHGDCTLFKFLSTMSSRSIHVFKGDKFLLFKRLLSLPKLICWRQHCGMANKTIDCWSITKMHLLKSLEKWWKMLCSYVGDQEGASRSWLQIGSGMDNTVTWTVNQLMENLFDFWWFTLHTCLSNENKHMLKRARDI